MSEMIERVARAMYHRAAMEAVKDLPNADREMDGWTLLLSESSREIWRDSARAAIEALREPTAAACKAGNLELDRYEDSDLAKGVWQIMIDAVLADDQATKAA